MYPHTYTLSANISVLQFQDQKHAYHTYMHVRTHTPTGARRKAYFQFQDQKHTYHTYIHAHIYIHTHRQAHSEKRKHQKHRYHTYIHVYIHTHTHQQAHSEKRIFSFKKRSYQNGVYAEAPSARRPGKKARHRKSLAGI